MKKILMFLLCVIVVSSSILNIYAENVTTEAGKPAFSDTKGHWAEATIERLSKQGIVNGVGNNRFEPDANMTRCQFASMLHKALGLQIRYFRACDISEVYKDVKNDAWYASQLYDLVTTGIVDDAVNYRPESFITREEIAHCIARAYEYKKGFTVAYNSADLERFKDRKDISPVFAEDFSKTVALKLITGKTDELLKPGEKSTRAEVTVVIDRLLNLLSAEV